MFTSFEENARCSLVYTWNVFPSNIESPCRIYVLTVTMATCFATECSLYLHLYKTHSSFRYDEFQDMRASAARFAEAKLFFLWIKCYSRLESSEVFHLFLNHNFDRGKRKVKSIFSHAQCCVSERETKKERKIKTNPRSTCICEHDLIVTDHFFIHIDIYEPKKVCVETLRC